MIGFTEHLDEIREKKHWWTRADFDITWEQMLHLIDTHPQRLYDWNREKQRLGLNEFHTRPSAPQFAKDVVAEMHEVFAKPAPKKEKPEDYEKGHPHITNIAFCGFGQYSGSYPRHADSMDVFLVQILNECKITIGYDKTPRNADEIRIMKPGDAVYLPRGTWHQLEPSVSRVTFSFAFESDADCDPKYFI